MVVLYEGDLLIAIGRPQLTGFTESEFNSLLLLHIPQGYHTYNYSAHNIPILQPPASYESSQTPAPEKIIHTAKYHESVEYTMWKMT